MCKVRKMRFLRNNFSFFNDFNKKNKNARFEAISPQVGTQTKFA